MSCLIKRRLMIDDSEIRLRIGVEDLTGHASISSVVVQLSELLYGKTFKILMLFLHTFSFFPSPSSVQLANCFFSIAWVCRPGVPVPVGRIGGYSLQFIGLPKHCACDFASHSIQFRLGSTQYAGPLIPRHVDSSLALPGYQ